VPRNISPCRETRFQWGTEIYTLVASLKSPQAAGISVGEREGGVYTDANARSLW